MGKALRNSKQGMLFIRNMTVQIREGINELNNDTHNNRKFTNNEQRQQLQASICASHTNQ